MNTIDIFLSHSSADEKVAKALIDLLRDAFHIEPNRIRCTSVSGYKLTAGAHAETELRREIQQARVFIGLLSEVSLESAYVLFEVGARWGSIQDPGMYSGIGVSKNKIFPVLAAGATVNIMRDPLKAYNALNCEKAGDLHQLISDIGHELNQQPGSAAAYQDKIETLIRVSKLLKAKRVRASKPPLAKAVTPNTSKRKPSTKQRITTVKSGGKGRKKK